VGKSKKIIICQSVSLDLVLPALAVERILGGMVFDTPVHPSTKRNKGAAAFGSPRRRLFSHQRIGLATPATTEDDFRFLRHVGSVIEAQNDLVKSSVTKLAESRELLSRINDLLRR
jgi:hypothetical protein